MSQEAKQKRLERVSASIDGNFPAILIACETSLEFSSRPTFFTMSASRAAPVILCGVACDVFHNDCQNHWTVLYKKKEPLRMSRRTREFLARVSFYSKVVQLVPILRNSEYDSRRIRKVTSASITLYRPDAVHIDKENHWARLASVKNIPSRERKPCS